MLGYYPIAYAPIAGGSATQMAAGVIEFVAGGVEFSGHPVEFSVYESVIEAAAGGVEFLGYPADVNDLDFRSIIEAPTHNPEIVFSTPRPADPAEIGDQLHYMPVNIWSGYSSDGVNITIPIAELPGLSASEADTAAGDWREVFQSMLLSLSDYMDWDKDDPISAYSRPQTISSFVLEDWNRPTVNEMRRYIKLKFNIRYVVQKITEEPT